MKIVPQGEMNLNVCLLVVVDVEKRAKKYDECVSREKNTPKNTKLSMKATE